MATDAYAAPMASRYDADFEAVFGGRDGPAGRGDVPFFVRVAASSEGPIAEIGAGTGRVITALAEVHPDRVCSGVEPSQAMREVFAAKGSIVAILDGHFGAIPLADSSQGYVFAAFRSFQHVLDVDAQLAALAELRRVLRPGGVLALDLFDPDYTRLQTSDWARGACYGSGRGTRIERWERRSVERASQIMTVRFRWIERRGGELVGVTDDRYRVRYTFRWELVHLLARAGFTDVTLFGDYAGNPVGEHTRELIVVVRR